MRAMTVAYAMGRLVGSEETCTWMMPLQRGWPLIEEVPGTREQDKAGVCYLEARTISETIVSRRYVSDGF